jgi:hypothetical protein
MARALKKKRLFVFVGLIFFLSLSWIATRTYGVDEACSVIAVPSKLPDEYRRVSPDDWRKLGAGTYYCEGSVVAPFVLRLDYGAACGSLCGSGAVEVMLWFPGFVNKLYWESVWIS